MFRVHCPFHQYSLISFKCHGLLGQWSLWNRSDEESLTTCKNCWVAQYFPIWILLDVIEVGLQDQGFREDSEASRGGGCQSGGPKEC